MTESPMATTGNGGGGDGGGGAGAAVVGGDVVGAPVGNVGGTVTRGTNAAAGGVTWLARTRWPAFRLWAMGSVVGRRRSTTTAAATPTNAMAARRRRAGAGRVRRRRLRLMNGRSTSP